MGVHWRRITTQWTPFACTKDELSCPTRDKIQPPNRFIPCPFVIFFFKSTPTTSSGPLLTHPFPNHIYNPDSTYLIYRTFLIHFYLTSVIPLHFASCWSIKLTSQPANQLAVGRLVGWQASGTSKQIKLSNKITTAKNIFFHDVH